MSRTLSSLTKVASEMSTSRLALSDLFDDNAFDKTIDDATAAALLSATVPLLQSASLHPLQRLASFPPNPNARDTGGVYFRALQMLDYVRKVNTATVM
jgi:hypothetical protein